MSEIEDKILGRRKRKSPDLTKNMLFGKSAIWSVFKAECGKTLVNGQMAYEMISGERKKEVLKGKLKIKDGDFEFECLKKGE